MPKRFTATEKWIDPWFCSLGEKDKLFWVYLLDNCNHAGIWQVNFPLVGFHIKNFKFDSTTFNGRVLEISKEKWFIPKFIEFQYGILSQENRAHKSVIDILEKEGAYKGLTSPILGCKDKDKDKDMVKDKETINNIYIKVPPKLEDVSKYCLERKNGVDSQKFFDYYQTRGWKLKGNQIMKDWQAAVRTWERSEYGNKPGTDEINKRIFRTD